MTTVLIHLLLGYWVLSSFVAGWELSVCWDPAARRLRLRDSAVIALIAMMLGWLLVLLKLVCWCLPDERTDARSTKDKS